ncbi:MAG: polysaccharide deacetylase family protein [bacterium]
MKIEEKYGVKSTFFFLQETKKVNPLNLELLKATSGKYKFSEERISSSIKLLLKNGWEIALHGSYDSYKDKSLLTTEKKLLEEITGEKIVGIRQHCLNIEIPKTWQLQKEIGFEYDSTYGSNEDVGFYNSKKFPFAPFHDAFLVLPITIMDTALFSKYRKIEEAWFKCKNVLLQARQTKCLVTVLWHQRVFNEKEFPGWKRIYEDIIAYSLENNAWVTCARNIVKWWKTNRLGVNYG